MGEDYSHSLDENLRWSHHPPDNGTMPPMRLRPFRVDPCLSLWLSFALACIPMVPSPLQAEATTTIQEVLSDPTLFHLRQITLHGTVRNVQPLDPYEIPAGSTCYGGYLFTLEDDTASLPVAVPGLCGIPLVKDPDVEDGARVAIEATIQAPSHGGYALSFKGGKIAMDQEGIVQAIATRITPLAD